VRVNIPTINTERLLLREFRESDFPAYVEMIGDPDVARFLADGRPLDRVEAWRQMAVFAGHWALRGYGVWAVEERATGNFIGRIGCFNPEGWPGFEVAYTLRRSAWGKGYASEGAAASLDYARSVLKKREIISVIRPGNVGSRNVATKLGATLVGTVEFYGGPAEIYRYPIID
jgi:RimJ/RimL family protein N-acetyltransferase